MRFGSFILLYSLWKLLRIMLAASVLMAVALAVCKAGGARRWRLHLALLSIVPLACLTGYSKIFYRGRLFLLMNQMQSRITVEMAAGYFLVAGFLAAGYVHRQKELRKWLHGLPYLEAKSDVPEGRGPKIKVYLSKECHSPFAGGIFRPYIVIPQIVKNSLSKEQLAAVFYHEALHIRRGHVLLLNIYAWLKIIWWIHPLIYILEEKLRENIEYSSDEGSVMLGPLGPYEYAGVLLKTIGIKRQITLVKEGISAFQDQRYSVLKKRMELLAVLEQENGTRRSYQKKTYRSAVLTLLAAFLTVSFIGATSMPRYTKMKEIAVYDEKLHPLTFDLEKDGFQAKAAYDRFYISKQELHRLTERYKPQGEYVIFSYGSIIKVPGAGGFGQAARVRVGDPSDICLMGRQEWPDRLMEFVMKYLI